MGNFDIKEYMSRIEKAKTFIENILPVIPKSVIVLGSGLSSLGDELDNKIEIAYKDIPGFPVSTVEGHKGSLAFGKLADADVLLMQGRFHYYEGYSIYDVVFPIRVFAALGIKKNILTNAAGGINKDLYPGDLMVIKDHIGFNAPSPLIGKNPDAFGTRFPDMSKIYKWEKILEHGERTKINLKTGNYFYSTGPMYETPAEIKAIHLMGGDAVGMSTVPEAITASHSGMEVYGISLISNYAAGIIDAPLTHKDVLEVGIKASGKMTALVKSLVNDFD